MTEEYIRGTQVSCVHQHEAQRSPEMERSSIVSAIVPEALIFSSQRGDLRLSGRGNASVRHSTLHAMQRTHGNRAVQRCIQRAGTLPVQRNVAPRPGAGKPGQSVPGAIWEALLKQLEKLPTKRPGPGEEGGPIAWDQDGKVLKRNRPQKRPCIQDEHQRRSPHPQMTCPDPWDWSQDIEVPAPNTPEVILGGEMMPPARGTNPPTPAHWEDGSQ